MGHEKQVMGLIFRHSSTSSLVDPGNYVSTFSNKIDVEMTSASACFSDF